jgi:hypothetical protein
MSNKLSHSEIDHAKGVIASAFGTLTEFAEYTGFARSTVVNYLHGRAVHNLTFIKLKSIIGQLDKEGSKECSVTTLPLDIVRMRFKVGDVVKIELIDEAFESDQVIVTSIIAIRVLKREYQYFVNAPKELVLYDADGDDLGVELHFSELKYGTFYTAGIAEQSNLFSGFNVKVSHF